MAEWTLEQMKDIRDTGVGLELPTAWLDNMIEEAEAAERRGPGSFGEKPERMTPMNLTKKQREAEARHLLELEAMGGEVLDRTMDGDDLVLRCRAPIPLYMVEAIERMHDRRLRAAMDAIGPEDVEGPGVQKAEPVAGRMVAPSAFAEMEGISKATVYRMINKGLPAPVVPHLGLRIDPEQGRAWMRAQRTRRTRRG